MVDEYVDVIKEGQIQRVSETEAKAEGFFILRRPTLVPGTPPKSPPPMIRSPSKQKYSLDYAHNNVRLDLIDHFNWEIAKYRKLKNLTRRQLGNLVGATEEHIKMVENGELPADNFALINRLEHYLGISLRKASTGAVQAVARNSSTHAVTERISREADKNISLAELQKRKAMRDKEKQHVSTLSGGDIELIE
jgi:transcriptional regulator with XRE-family HTH domain